ncbi:MAG: GspH/FimT family pseudopilin [Ramlibacter sp.]|nr:GspH/FimT family pseudopilin [Ramlibacter sp.]
MAATLHMNSARRRRARHGGFTLIELMVTLTILGIMMGVGIPSFRNFIAAQRVKSAAYDMTAALIFARSEAIKRNASITVAPTSGTNWAGGWTVKAGTTTLQEQQVLSGAVVEKAASASTIPANFVYGANGRLSSAASTQYLQISNGSTYKCVKIDSIGIPSTQTVACP